MGKRDNLQELARFIGLAVAHAVGDKVDPSSLYADKYRKEVVNFITLAKKAKDKEYWNGHDIQEIKEKSREEAIYELSRKDHVDKSKFDMMDEEMNTILKDLEIE